MKRVLWLSVIWIAPLMTYFTVNEGKFKKNICVGVTLPLEAREHAQVKNTINVFAKESWIACGGIVALGILFMLAGGKSIMMTLWGIWITLCIFVPYVTYIKAHLQLKKLKKECGWVQEKKAVAVDTSALSIRKWLSPWLFAPACVMCLVPIAVQRDFWPLSALYAGMCALCWLGYRYLYRNKAEIVDADTELTKALTSIRRYNWGKVWLLIAYSLAGYCLAQLLGRWQAGLSIGLFIVITIIICVAAFRIEMNTRRLQETLTAGSGGDWYVDDDDYWIGGLVYYNPNDARVLINNRVGVNTTVNLATVPGKIMGVMLVIVLAVLPFMGVWFDAIGNSEIQVTMKEEQVVATNGMSTYKVDKGDIQEVVLLEQLPDKLTREMGTGMDTLLEGRFSSKEYGAMSLLCDPSCPPFVLIRTEKKIYLFGTRDANETRMLYEELKK